MTRKCLLRRLVYLWGARTKHAVLMRIASHMLPQRATYFSDGPIRNHRCWPTPRPRRAVFALLETRNRLPIRELTTLATASVPGLPDGTTRHLQAQPCESPWSNQELTCQRVQTESTLLLFLPCEVSGKAIPGERNLCAPPSPRHHPIVRDSR